METDRPKLNAGDHYIVQQMWGITDLMNRVDREIAEELKNLISKTIRLIEIKRLIYIKRC
jgi:hypothetical protein